MKWETPPAYDEDEARGAELSAYQALAFAVRNEERAFAFYSYVAAEAENAEIRALAEDFARDELQHAALLRQYRRRAFHEHRPAKIETPQNIDESARAGAALGRGNGRRPCRACPTRSAPSENHPTPRIFRRLAEEEHQSAEGAAAVTVLKLRGAVDGLRTLEECFDRYASIAEHASDEAVVAEAQKLAGQIVARLALAGGARSNALFGSDKNR